jgi:hypothetical protein
MKIRVVQKGKKYNITLLDGDSILKEDVAHSIAERDTLVWRYAETYNVIDIDVKSHKMAKQTSVPSIPVLTEEDAHLFFEENQEFTHNRIIVAVEEGVKNHLETLNLFELNGSNVYITSDREHWRAGLMQALEYFEDVEMYERCNKIQKLLHLV